MRIDRLLSELGICTRSQVKQLIKDGRVQVNGEEILSPSQKVNEKAAIVRIDDVEYVYEEFVYFALNKPVGYGTGYPYIQITNEKHPRLLYARSVVKSKGRYYGPFPDGSRAYRILNYLNQVYPLKKCPPSQKQKCLYYDIQQCLGACFKEVSREDYAKNINGIDRVMKGNYQEVLVDLNGREARAVERLDFESASRYRDLISALANVSGSQAVDLLSGSTADFVGYHAENGMLALVIFSYVEGKLLAKHSVISEQAGEPSEDAAAYLIQFYSQNLVPKRIYVSLSTNEMFALGEALGSEVLRPERGKLKTVLLTAVKNSRQTLLDQNREQQRKRARTEGAVEQLGALLAIAPPRLIEVFDNSNIQGDSPVAAMVVYRNGVKSPSLYRKFHVREVKGPNDFATFQEIIYRRYFKVLNENLTRPDLVLVDGGAPQVQATLNALRSLGMNLPVAGLAKDHRHRTNALIKSDLSETILERESALYFLLANMQEEVHRFAISFFSKTRAKSLIRSALDGIEGLGSKRQQTLIEQFGAINRIKEASLDELSQYVPPKVAAAILAKMKATST
ncbi:unnamed protein product [Didymodactylos carnosus]|uniref:Excinuclease ABC subunit C n=1 Tax=Didymodactylos carnosus TaxID=1234261 RepID=A0A8S2GCG9_9BILA|nr:unnamed protein product [Didymodactylos carnosus]CAF3491848.1 unnamed protein product [Didymodactylos carnosus]